MATSAETRTPVHLWIVGILALLWNAFGCFDYFMTRTQGATWINQAMSGVDGNKYMAYIDSFPLWASIGWGLGVWLGLAGSILLLMRSRYAVWAFGISLIGALLGIGYQLMNPVDIPEMTRGFNAFVPYLVMLVAAFLAWYAWTEEKRGVLR